jgi:hypothetical protein
MLVLMVAAAKRLTVKEGTPIDLARLPFWPTCLALV